MQKPQNNFKILSLIILAAFLGAGVGTVSKITIREIPPVIFTFFRFIAAGVILIPILYKQGYKISKQKFLSLLIVSLFAAGNVTFFIFGVKRTTASISQMLYAAVPLLVALLSYLFLKDKISVRKLLGVLVGFVGVLLIIFLPILGKQSIYNGDLIGNLITFTAVFSFSLYTVLSKKFQKNNAPIELTSYFILTTLIVQMALLPIGQNNTNWNQHLSWQALLGILYVGAIGTAVYYLLHQYILKQASATYTSTILYLQPIFAIVWAAILLSERITYDFIIGGILAFLGVILVTNSEKNFKLNIMEVNNENINYRGE